MLTDLPELVELMETNIRANSDCFSHLPKAMPLVWSVSTLTECCMQVDISLYIMLNGIPRNLNYYLHICITFKRGQDISEFLPHPDVILMADLIYYEEVDKCSYFIVIEMYGGL